MLKPLSKGIIFISKVIDKIGRIIHTDPQAIRTKNWYKDPQSGGYKYEFNLNRDSVVFDLGGFEGQWASDIYSRYLCKIYIFEPVPAYASEISRRFAQNSDVIVHAFGLGGKNEELEIAIQGEGSSTLNKSRKSETVIISIRSVSEYLKSNNITSIDLMKINIEGAEYDLLEDLLKEDKIGSIDNLLIQFHDFFPDAKSRMTKIHEGLSKTHERIFYHEFVWEAWKLKRGS